MRRTIRRRTAARLCFARLGFGRVGRCLNEGEPSRLFGRMSSDFRHHVPTSITGANVTPPARPAGRPGDPSGTARPTLHRPLPRHARHPARAATPSPGHPPARQPPETQADARSGGAGRAIVQSRSEENNLPVFDRRHAPDDTAGSAKDHHGPSGRSPCAFRPRRRGEENVRV